MKAGRPEAPGIGEALQFILHKSMLGLNLVNGPHNSEAKAIRVIDGTCG